MTGSDSGPEDRARPRSAPRAPVQVQFSAGRVDGTGVIGDLSLSGAWIAEASASPAAGTLIALFLDTGAGEPVRATAEVVRRTAKGFAVRFPTLNPQLRDFLSAALPPEATRSETLQR